MEDIIGDFFVVNNELVKCSEVNNRYDNSDYQVYEVVRTESGKIFFFKDHLLRLHESMRNINIDELYDEVLILSSVEKLLNANKSKYGNIKLICGVFHQKFQFATFYIPHYYPDPEYYKTGVKLITFPVERSKPNIKQIEMNQKIRSKISTIKETTDVYEILLVNSRQEITEGSTSNFFLIKKNVIYTAPEEVILKGITRKYVLLLCNSLKIKVRTNTLKLEELSDYDAAFICGTSPKILPVVSINQIMFDQRHPVIRDLIEAYDVLIKDHLE